MKLLVNSFAKMKCEPLLYTLRYLKVHWKSVVIVVLPCVFLPLALLPGKEAKCGYILCVMAGLWVTEALPIAVTSFVPLVLLPLFGILSSQEVSMLYLKDTNIMFLAGVLIAVAVEHCNLHKRIALKVMLIVGCSPRRLLVGFMFTTMFLSMWISNSATAAMMVPIVTAILEELQNSENKKNNPQKTEDMTESAVTEVDEANKRGSDVIQTQSEQKEKICYYLGIAYAANIGGTGTITGTATNLVLKGVFESLFEYGEGVNFATWMEFNVPLMALNTILACVWLQFLYLDLCRTKGLKRTAGQNKLVRELILNDYKRLGPVSFHEGLVLFLFVLVTLLWVFSKPEFVPGWTSFFPEKEVKDGTPGIAVALLLFILPANLDFFKYRYPKVSPPLLPWSVAAGKIPFGIILLLGSGFALSKACEVSGLSTYMGNQLDVIKALPPLLTLAVILYSTTFATEVSSNTAIANILLPVLGKMCLHFRIHPLYLMMPATICCSYAFMLPVATPPNAIVAAAAKMSTFEMMKAGVVMNILSVTTLFLCFIFIGVPMYGLDKFPKWADRNFTAH